MNSIFSKLSNKRNANVEKYNSIFEPIPENETKKIFGTTPTEMVNHITKQINNATNRVIEEIELTASANKIENKHSITIPTDVLQTGIIPNITEFNTLVKKDGWNHDSEQYKLSLEWIKKGRQSSRNIATIDGRYLVAVSQIFGDVGDKIDVILENGESIECIILDAKEPTDANAAKYGHLFTLPSGNKAVDVIEWESMVNRDDKDLIDLSGWRNEKVVEIINITKSN